MAEWHTFRVYSGTMEMSHPPFVRESEGEAMAQYAIIITMFGATSTI
jgi:hypothetical protein